MDVSPYVAQLREDLATAAAAGDEQTRRTAALLGAAIEPAARLAIMNALSDLAADVTAALGDRTVDLRLDGREVRVSVGDESHRAHEAPSAGSGSGSGPGAGAGSGGPAGSPGSSGSSSDAGVGGFGMPGLGPGFGGPGFGSWPGAGFGPGSGAAPDAGDISRVTLRIVEQIKSQAEQAAQAQGVSLNTWVAQAVQGALGNAFAERGQAPGSQRRPGPDRTDDGRRLRGWVQG